MKLTPTDRLLVGLLKQDARRSFTEMAQIAGVSRETVRKRINRLRETGVIRRFTVETDMPRNDEAGKGGEMTRVLFLLRFHRQACARLAAFVSGWPEVRASWTASGENDFVILAEAAGQAEVARLHDKLLRHPDVVGITTMHLMKTWIDRR